MAQSTVTAQDLCLKIEAELDNMNAGIYPQIVNQDQTYGAAAAAHDHSGMGMTEILSMLNTAPNGTNVRVDVKYREPVCGEGTDPDLDFSCDRTAAANASQAFESDTFTLGRKVSDAFTIKASDFDASCETPEQQFAMNYANRARQLYRRYNAGITAAFGAGVGSDYTSAIDTAVNPLDLKLVYTNPEHGTFMPQPAAVTDIYNQYERMGFVGTSPIVLSGARAVRSFVQAGQLFAGNDWGFDPNRVEVTSNIYQDYQLATAIDPLVADNPVITLMPGTFELVHFYEYDTEYRNTANGRVSWAPVQASGRVVRQKVDLGPAIGINRPFIVDQQLIYDEVCNSVEVMWILRYDIWNMPQGAFCDGDSYNGKLLWNVVNAAYTGADAMA